MNPTTSGFNSEAQSSKKIKQLIDKLDTILMSDEQIEYISVQQRPITIFPKSLAITSKRIILCEPKNFGFSMEFQDYHWKDVLKCNLKEGVLGGVFSLETHKGETLQMKYIPKSQARKLYAISQEQGERQSLLRRQIELENKKASASNVTINPSRSQTEKTPQENPVVALQNLKTLLENGDLTKIEFESKKTEILSRI